MFTKEQLEILQSVIKDTRSKAVWINKTEVLYKGRVYKVPIEENVIKLY